jgi:hypothetical protein
MIKIVPDWRKSWKWLSMNIPAINVAFLATWALLPEKFQDAISMEHALYIAIALIGAGMFGRLVDQNGAKDEPKP